MAVIECVPNFSEGRDSEIMNRITKAIQSVAGVEVLHLDMGLSANRSVVTFVGTPETVVEGAFRGIKQAAELIDMSKQQGAHPRIGATDVCPLVPVSGISMEETVQWARKLGKRVGDELGIPVYLYENAAWEPKRKNLANIRKGGYENLKLKLLDAEWKPDFGPAVFNEKSGATVIGARDFLLAYNVNLDTKDEEKAKMIAAAVRRPGAVKAIGWYMEQYELAQVSMNLTDLKQVPVHEAYELVQENAGNLGIKVTGSELIGLAPLSCMTGAGRYFLQKTMKTVEQNESILIAAAVQALGLDALKRFDAREKILEYAMTQYKVYS